MNSAFDVATYILEKKGTLTGYQLEKLLYYCQAWHLVATGEPLFCEEIRAYRHGPVVQDVSLAHQGRRWIHAGDLPGSAARVPASSSCIVDAVLASYGDMSGEALERLTHSEEPWKVCFNNQTGYSSASIPTESLYSYYSALYAAGAQERDAHHVPTLPDSSRVYVTREDYDWLDTLED